MSSAEAVFRCKSAIEKTEIIYSELENNDFKKIANAAILLMQKVVDEITNGISYHDLPNKAQQCIKHAEQVMWLKDSILPVIQIIKTEKKELIADQENSDEPESKKSKHLTKKKKREGKVLNINQRQLDKKALEKKLTEETEIDKKSSASTTASKAML